MVNLGAIEIPVVGLVVRFFEDAVLDTSDFKEVTNYSVEDNALQDCPDQALTKEDHDALVSAGGVEGCESSLVLSKNDQGLVGLDEPVLEGLPGREPEGNLPALSVDEVAPSAPSAAPATSPGR